LQIIHAPIYKQIVNIGLEVGVTGSALRRLIQAANLPIIFDLKALQVKSCRLTELQSADLFVRFGSRELGAL
jgi:hypothetical protein